MDARPLEPGYRIVDTLTLTEDEIISGAKFLNDRNPIHNDPVLAAASRFGGVIACGPHVSGIHACMLPSHCTDLGFDVLGTVFTVRYTAPFHANVLHDLNWAVSAIAPHRSAGNFVEWTGAVSSRATGVVCIEATGQVLVTQQN